METEKTGSHCHRKQWLHIPFLIENLDKCFIFSIFVKVISSGIYILNSIT